ncbi:uncharacterized protein LOC120528859 [Polypterus senegalus]|uniref:uncharacterized protein LOC120528859 n=1 Tax=Polypterus senegalus TaxID=55291 RepID=UPI0019653E2F|nr:uncharacterized protein LOC120528859 [Polypterus senegalus]
MLEAFGDATDIMGIPLLDRDKIQEIWKTQRRHLHCIQDPPGMHLYMQTGRLVKWEITLPVFRCAQGSTCWSRSTCIWTASYLALKPAYLLEGLARWNKDRAAQAVEVADHNMVCYSGQLQHSLNELSDLVYHKNLVEDYTWPAKYTGEMSSMASCTFFRIPVEGPIEEPLDNTLFGLEEDFAQQPLSSDKSQLRPAIRASQSGPADQETCPGDKAIQRVSHEPSLEAVSPCLRDAVASGRDCHPLGRLPVGDKAPVCFPPHYQERLVKGRFRRKHLDTSVTPCMVGQGSQAAQMPNISRLVEAVCIQLSRIHPEGRTISGVRVNRWAAVMRHYICIQENILTNPVLMAQTRIQLFPLNQRTLAQWHYARTRELVRWALPLLRSPPLPYAHGPRAPSSPLQNSFNMRTHLTYPVS